MECATHPWTSWTICSTLCGTGIQTRWRAYKEPRLAQLFGCNITLNQSQNCIGKQCSQAKDLPEEIDAKPECELSEWSPWSTCSNNCGEGFIRRTRYYFNDNAKSKCQQRYPRQLEQSKSCMGEICGGNIQNKNENEETDSDPDLFGYVEKEEDTYGQRNSKEFEEDDDNSDKQEIEIDAEPNNYANVPRYCSEWPAISNETCRKKVLNLQNYWFYNAWEEKCIVFTADNCDQNKNKFNSEESCQSTCMPGFQIRNGFSNFATDEPQNQYDYKNPNRLSDYNKNQRTSSFGQSESQIRNDFKNHNRFSNFAPAESQNQYDYNNPNGFSEYNKNQRQSKFGQSQSQNRYDNRNPNRFSEYNINQWNPNLAQPESQNQYDKRNPNRFSEHDENQWNPNLAQPESQNRYDYQKSNRFVDNAPSYPTYNRKNYGYF